MDKNNSIHLEEAMSPYATPFVENKELEKRCAVTYCKDRRKNAAKKEQNFMESGHSLDPTVVCHGKFICDVLLTQTLLIPPASTS